MGRGIALVLLQEIAVSELKVRGTLEHSEKRFILIDVSINALQDLRIYLNDRLKRFAEKNINQLREFYDVNTDLVSNTEMIDVFVAGALALAEISTVIEAAQHATIVFEAIIEDVELKVETLKRARKGDRQFFFSNTSSIPIHVLTRKTDFPQ